MATRGDRGDGRMGNEGIAEMVAASSLSDGPGLSTTMQCFSRFLARRDVANPKGERSYV